MDADGNNYDEHGNAYCKARDCTNFVEDENDRCPECQAEEADRIADEAKDREAERAFKALGGRQ